MSIGPAAAAALAFVAPAAFVAWVTAASDDRDSRKAVRDARALVRAPDFERAIDDLERVEEWSDLEGLEAAVARRGELAARLARDVRAGGAELVDAAVDLVLEGAGEDRRRAELLLAQLDRLPPAAYARLEGAERFDAWALSLLHRRSRGDFLIDPPPDEGSWWSLMSPVSDVAADLRERLAFDGRAQAGFNEEFLEAYRRDGLARLERLAENVASDEYLATDLDGDDDPEVVVAARVWKDSGFHEQLGFVALVDRDGRAASWRVVAFERMEDGDRLEEFIARDFDRDGTIEVAVRTRLQGWDIGTVRMVRKDATAPFPRVTSWSPCGEVLLLERTRDEPARFVETRTHIRGVGGTVSELVGVLASERRCFEWKGDRFVEAETIFAPYR